MWRKTLASNVRRFSLTNPWGDPVGPVIPFAEREQRGAFLSILEKSGLNKWVFFVAASGFLTDSYNLFASNVILPALSYLYWHENGYWDIYFNLATLIASAIGQVVFGILADVYGRRSLYGIELIIVIVSTIGLLQSSSGYMDPNGNTTWNIKGWLLAWRAVMGFGIGAEYPLSACIAAEWSSAQSRAPMMCLVFLMQPLGQLCAYAAGFSILHVIKDSPADVDIFWRYVVAMGCVPTIFALVFRLSIPESGRFTFDVLKNEKQADTDTSRIYSSGNAQRHSVYRTGVPPPGSQFRSEELWAYLIEDGNWLYLFGASACWFLLDFAFFGLGFNNPSMLARLWTDHPLSSTGFPWWPGAPSPNYNCAPPSLEEWNPSLDCSLALIKQVLHDNMKHGILIVSIASILGSLLMVTVVNKIKRKQILTLTFSILAVLLFALAGSFVTLYGTVHHDVLIMFWVLISFFFNFGPNTLTFIFPAEIFPTRYRCTFYGIAAASGKIGAVVVQLALLRPSLREASSAHVWRLILAFGFCMALGALVSMYCLPVVQYRASDEPDKLRSWTLEALAGGRQHQVRQAEATGIEMVDSRGGHDSILTERRSEANESYREGSSEHTRVDPYQ